MYTIILYYKYTPIADPEALVQSQQALCNQLGLTGRIIIAAEGINGTLEGRTEHINEYLSVVRSDARFADVDFKISAGTGAAFPKLSIKARDEIVSAHLGTDDVNPARVTGKYITAEQLHDWIHSGREFYIIDMRNSYEHAVGYFAGSVLPPLKNFRDLPQALPKLAHLKNKTIVTVCTGGVRCEKASGFLLTNGFKDVYQLYGGIVTYMEKYPNEDFKGALYVFDGRVTMGFNLDDKEHEIIGRCVWCKQPTERYIDCVDIHCSGPRHVLCCGHCVAGRGRGYCSWWCKIWNNIFVKQFCGIMSLGKK
ncbi:MAG: rhodanese-related sulfurtransferase [bacterium]|nr:rhodanese-related sulfurtransferase [bacterium]